MFSVQLHLEPHRSHQWSVVEEARPSAWYCSVRLTYLAEAASLLRPVNFSGLFEMHVTVASGDVTLFEAQCQKLKVKLVRTDVERGYIDFERVG